jgi:hypothetical protein
METILMSRMSDLALEIADRLANGDSMCAIADELRIPIEWVASVSEMVSETAA